MATECRSRKAPIEWVTTESGRKMPVDAEPEKRAVRVHDHEFRELDTESDLIIMVDTFISHFATCPNADLHRKRLTEGHSPR